MARITRYLLMLSAVLALVACSSSPRQARDVAQQPAIYPDYTDVTVPADIAPLNFAMADDDVSAIDVEVTGSKGGTLHASGTYADFELEAWHQLLSQNKGGRLSFCVSAEKSGQWVRYQPFTVSVSPVPLGEWGITYRLVAPSYKIYSRMGLYQRCLSNFEETVMIDNTDLHNTCLNCHTANQTNPDRYVFHIRGERGGTAIVRDGKVELLKASRQELGGAMVYPYWHPQGRYCAFSTNSTAQMFHMASNKRIEVYDEASDVFVYDTETGTVINDSLIMKHDWAENCPAFSPDGRWLYFITARRQTYPHDFDKERYSLCRVAFDAATGKIGTQVDTLVHTAQTGKSVTWPRPSYDGRYLIYTQADYGYFSIWHPEADLWLMDLSDATTRPLSEVNSHRAESLHSWSANSHWFLFTSRRDDGLYTRVYFSFFDKGRATKPFMLPQRDPRRYYRRLMYSYNTPDFTSKPVEISPDDMTTRIRDPKRQ